jgi:single-strand DNA-binding protein
MNTVILVGALGQDPRQNPNKTVCNLRVATNGRAKVDGEWADITDWHNVVVFGTQGENAARFLNKGSEVAISGRLVTRSYEKDGQKIWVTEVVANEVKFIGKRSQEEETGTDNSEEKKYLF